MSDNLLLLDAANVSQQVRTTETAGVHVPHNIIESMPDVTVLPMPDYGLACAAGLVSGASALNKFGRNMDVDTAASEDVWGYGGTWVPPTTARVHNIKSASINDVATSGTGAWTVLVSGLNGSWEEVSETVNLNGTSNVATAHSYVIIHRMIVKTAGAGGKNAGVITATAQTDGTVTASIEEGVNQTLTAIWQVPAGKSLYLSKYYASVNALTAAKVDVFLWAKPYGEVWQLKHIIGLDSTGSSILEHCFAPPVKYSEKTILRLGVTSSVNNTDVSAGFDGIYM